MTDSSMATMHIALLPSSGMGHLTPFLRLAARLDACGYTVTFISILPTVSSSESSHQSRFFSTYPRIRCMEFHLLPFDPSTASSTDPFFLQFEAIRRSVHLLPPLLTSTSPSISALITDISLTSSIVDVVANLPFSNYILFTASASMLAFCAYFPIAAQSNTSNENSHLQVPGVPHIQKLHIPPLLLQPTNLFKTQFIENGLALVKTDGILLNTFDALEPDTLVEINKGAVVPALPPVVAVGPLEPCDFNFANEEELTFSWLNVQPAGSVVYVSFGSRTALSGDQIKQLAVGLKMCECRFLWVVKSTKVDKEDRVQLGELVGDEFLESVRERGLVVNGWVEQWGVLGHPAVGGFVSHCGWNSLTEAAWHGVPVLAWPQGGDQRINAGVVEKSGFGIWERKWDWCGDQAQLVMGSEIAKRVHELMSNQGIRAQATRIRDEARRAVAVGGSSANSLVKVMEALKSRAT